jgi:hypothetical protein
MPLHILMCDEVLLRLDIVRSLNRAKSQFGLLFGNGLKNRKKNLFSPSHVGPKALCALRPAQSQPGFIPHTRPEWPVSRPHGAITVGPPGFMVRTTQV